MQSLYTICGVLHRSRSPIQMILTYFSQDLAFIWVDLDLAVVKRPPNPNGDQSILMYIKRWTYEKSTTCGDFLLSPKTSLGSC